MNYNIPNIENVVTWQTELAGQTMSWLGEDNQEQYEKKLTNATTRRQLEQSGWLTTTLEYSFNSHGFRSPEFDPTKDHFCAFGDSVTAGVALRYDQIYSTIIESKLGITCYNFGHAGGSDSTSIRLALNWLPKLAPKFIIYQTTFVHRFEWYEPWNYIKHPGVNGKYPSDIRKPVHGVIYGVQPHGGGSVPTIDCGLYEHWITVDLNQDLMAIKNLMIMRYLCQQLNIQLIEVSIDEFFTKPDDKGRDLLHPGPKMHQLQAERILDKLSWEKS
jgi:hypothetical protein